MRKTDDGLASPPSGPSYEELSARSAELVAKLACYHLVGRDTQFYSLICRLKTLLAHVERTPEGRGAQAERGQHKQLTRVGTDWWVESREGDHYQIDCFTGPGAEQQAREFMAKGVCI